MALQAKVASEVLDQRSITLYPAAIYRIDVGVQTCQSLPIRCLQGREFFSGCDGANVMDDT